MTSAELETGWLSLRHWVQRCVLPSVLTLIGLLLSLPIILKDNTYQTETSVVFTFFTVYFVLIRGGHLIMIRSMHFDLRKTYGKTYEARLAKLPRDLRRVNLGFTLTRIKRDLIHNSRP